MGALDKAGQGAVRNKRHFPGEQLVKNQAYREQVGTLIQIFPECLLGRHVFHGPDQGSGLSHAAAFERARQPKVHHQHAARLVAHDVLRLQVTMDDSHAVGRVKRLAHLPHDFHRLLRR